MGLLGFHWDILWHCHDCRLHIEAIDVFPKLLTYEHQLFSRTTIHRFLISYCSETTFLLQPVAVGYGSHELLRGMCPINIRAPVLLSAWLSEISDPSDHRPKSPSCQIPGANTSIWQIRMRVWPFPLKMEYSMSIASPSRTETSLRPRIFNSS